MLCRGPRYILLTRRLPQKLAVRFIGFMLDAGKHLAPYLVILSVLVSAPASQMQARTTEPLSIEVSSSLPVDQLIIKWSIDPWAESEVYEPIGAMDSSPADQREDELNVLASAGIQIVSREQLLPNLQQWNHSPTTRTFPQPSSIHRAEQSSYFDESLRRIEVLRFVSGYDAAVALTILAQHPNIDYVEPDHIVSASGISVGISDSYGEMAQMQQGANDAFYPQQWSLKNTGQSTGTVGADINIESAWAVTEGSSETLVAVIDSGADLDHPDLVAKLVTGFDFVNNDNDPDDPEHNGPEDDYSLGHGTHVAGIIGASTNNGTGVAGVCPTCRLMPLKVLDATGNGNASKVAQAIYYALENEADIINTSLGTPQLSITLQEAVDAAYDANVPIIAAMGNKGLNQREYPAAFSKAIGIGFTDHSDRRLFDSNYGTWIDLVAPGEMILNTGLDGEYVFFSGSSMATPHVSGVVGLLHALNPNFTVEDVRNVLRSTAADQIGLASEDTPGFDIYYGAGRLDAGAALSPISTTPTNTPTSEPTEAPTETPTDIPTTVPTLIPTATLTPTHTPTLTPTATLTPTHTPTETPTATSTATLTPTHTPTLTPTVTLTPTITLAPTVASTGTSTSDPTIESSPTQVPNETEIPTSNQTLEAPKSNMTTIATPPATASPTSVPTIAPLPAPTDTPTPTKVPVPTRTPVATATAKSPVSQKELEPIEGGGVNGNHSTLYMPFFTH